MANQSAETDPRNTLPSRPRRPRPERMPRSGGSASAGRGDGRSGAPKTRVLLVGIRRLLAEALAALLERDAGFEVVGAAENFRAAVARGRETRPHVALVDDASLRADGADSAEFRADLPDVPLLVLAAAVDDEAVSRCAQVGAAGCVPVDCSAAELAGALRRAAAGDVLFAPDHLLRLLRPPLRPVRAAAAHLSARSPVTPREREVLRALATGLSTERVADRLGISVHTVRTHVKNVLMKLDAGSTIEAIAIALRAGWIELPG